MRRTPDAAAQGGFTLLEVLVAFIIAALALGVMFSSVLGGMRTAKVADHVQEAVVLAQSRLAAAMAAVDAGVLSGGEQQGDDGNGFHWTVRVRPAATVGLPRTDDTAPNAPPSKATLFAISVAVNWSGDGGQRRVRLDGARLAMRAQPSS